MEGRNLQRQLHVAPFVAKTYQMVNDPSTDHLIRWGGGNNSFLVLDPLQFSRVLLPAYFKHSNFSSFIRQLNTYGFRKVDFDKWEFAHESFLRGQIHLLPTISRRKKSVANDCSSSSSGSGGGITGPVAKKEAAAEDGDEEMLVLLRELERLKREQEEVGVELLSMNQKLKAMEGRPEKMMRFLVRAVEDPDLLRLALAKKNQKQKQQQLQKEHQKLISIPPPRHYPPPPPPLAGSAFYPFETELTHMNMVPEFPLPLPVLGVVRNADVGLGGSGDATVAVPPVVAAFGAPFLTGYDSQVPIFQLPADLAGYKLLGDMESCDGGSGSGRLSPFPSHGNRHC